MDRKLTLKLDSKIILRAKSYAKKKNTSLSKLIESYLGLIVEPESNEEVTPLVRKLSGIIQLPKDFDYKKEYQNHVIKKYSKK